MKVAASVIFCAFICALASCSSSSSSGRSHHSASGSASEPRLSGDFDSICNYLVSTDALKRADDLAALGSSASTGDVAKVRTELQKVADAAPTVMQTALQNILNQVGTDSTPQVVPDSRLLAGECRARNLPIPATG